MPKTRYATTPEGVHVAYQVVENGAFSHLLVFPDALFADDQLWEDPGWS